MAQLFVDVIRVPLRKFELSISTRICMSTYRAEAVVMMNVEVFEIGSGARVGCQSEILGLSDKFQSLILKAQTRSI